MFATSTSFFRSAAGAFGTLILAGLCVAGATAPAQANEARYTVRSEVVRTQDLNLASAAGRDTLSSRIETAAERVCATQASDIASRADHNRCLRDAVATARAQISTVTAASN